MEVFKIHWQHIYNGERSNNELFKSFEPLPELELSATEAAERYAKSLSCGMYSVRYIGASSNV